MKVKIQDIASLSNGINFGKSAYTSSGIKLIGVSDFKNRMYPDFDSLQKVKADVVKEGDYLCKGDIVFVRSNGNKELVGRCMMINQDVPVTFSGFCIKLRLKDLTSCNPVYFTYLFKSNDFRKAMAGTAVGANIQNLSQGRLGNYEINLPPRSIQDSIATTLSRYDNLIANYQRQIKLLEEAAQRLYKEWFVDLHFPGHENVKVIDGVPEGWEKCELGDIATFKRGKTITKNNIKEGNVPVVAGGLNPAYFHDTANTKAPVITVSGSGANAGYTRLYHTDVWASDCSYIDQSTSESIYFVYCFLKVNKVYLDNLQKGAAQPHVYAKDINQMPILKPSQGILDAFNNLVKLYFNTIGNLEHQITLLTESRDRFLPKLMSGEIELKI